MTLYMLGTAYICHNSAQNLFCNEVLLNTLSFCIINALHVVMAELKAANKAYDLKSLKCYYLAFTEKMQDS